MEQQGQFTCHFYEGFVDDETVASLSGRPS